MWGTKMESGGSPKQPGNVVTTAWGESVVNFAYFKIICQAKAGKIFSLEKTSSLPV